MFDHSVLTYWKIPFAGLTSAMYMRGDVKVPNPDPQSGLYIRDRLGTVAKVNPDLDLHFGLYFYSFERL